MPDYKTGTYLMCAKKPWVCEHCKTQIKVGERHMARVQEVGNVKTRWDGQSYREKVYTRFHLNCAHSIQLNPYEQSLVKKF